MRVKLYAVFLGPVGLGVISQFTTFTNLITSTVHIGIPFSLTAILPGLYKNGDLESKHKIFSYFRYFINIFLFATIVVTFSIILFSHDITELLIDDAQHNIILTIVSFSIPFTVLYAIIESFLRSSGQIGRMVRISVFANLISLPILIILIQILNLEGVAVYLAVLGIMPFLLALTLYNRIFGPDFTKSNYTLTNIDKKNVYKTGITSLLAFLFFQSTILYLRKFIILNFGLESNGLYQSVFGLSFTIFSLIYSFLGNHTLPQLSMQKSADEINSVIDETARFLLLIIVPILLLVYNFREVIIQLFYSKSFISAANLILYQLLGDCFRIFASLFSLWLFSRFKIKQLIIIDLIFNILLLILPNIFVKVLSNNLIILPYSYFFASFFQFTLYFLYTKKTLKFKFSNRTVMMILTTIITVVFSVFISTYFIFAAYFTVWGFLIVWLYVFLKYIEKILIKTIWKKIKYKYLKID